LTAGPVRVTILKLYHSLNAMSVVSKPGQFDPGETVHARFFGAKTFVVKEIAKTESLFPHYFCQSGDEVHLIPMIWLSRRDLLPLVEDGNRRQLELPLAPS